MKPRGTRAFTLLELLVAAAITVALAALLLTVTTNVLAAFRKTQDALGGAAQARLALDLIERDLETALQRADGHTWLAVDLFADAGPLANHGWVTAAARLKPAGGASLRPLPEPGAAGEAPAIRDARFGWSGAWLRCFATNVESGGALPIAVSYQVVRRPVTGPLAGAAGVPVRYLLMRAAVSPENTFAAGYAIMDGAYQGTAAPAATRAAASVMNPSGADALANNVVDFGVWLHVRNPDGTWRRVFPGAAGDVSHAASGGVGVADGSRFPEVADVMLRVLTEEGATLLDNLESGRAVRPPEYGSDADWWWGLVEAHSRVFTRRVVLRGGAP